MEKAFDHYKSQGYTTFDVSKKKDKGYDIECERPGSTKFVEVKGTPVSYTHLTLPTS